MILVFFSYILLEIPVFFQLFTKLAQTQYFLKKYITFRKLFVSTTITYKSTSTFLIRFYHISHIFSNNKSKKFKNFCAKIKILSRFVRFQLILKFATRSHFILRTALAPKLPVRLSCNFQQKFLSLCLNFQNQLQVSILIIANALVNLTKCFKISFLFFYNKV